MLAKAPQLIERSPLGQLPCITVPGLKRTLAAKEEEIAVTSAKAERWEHEAKEHERRNEELAKSFKRYVELAESELAEARAEAVAKGGDVSI